MNQDKKALMKTAASYTYDMHATVADMAGWEKTSAGAKIMKSAFEYNQQLDEALTDMIDVMDESEQRFMGSKNNLLAQGKRISKLIDDLEDCVASCTAQLTVANGKGRV